MKKYLLIVAALICVTSVRAQYYASHPILQEANQIIMQMQMSNAAAAYQGWTAPQIQFQTPSWGDTSNWSESSTPQTYSYETVTEKCSNCNGEGFITDHYYSREGGYTSRRRCSFCHGTGQIKKRVLKED